MAGKEESATEITAPQRPTISLPPRPSMESLFAGGFGLSPGPMTLVSSFFSDNYSDTEYKSFSQLLAGAMASPGVRPSFLADNSVDNSSREVGSKDDSGFKQSRPTNLVVARSPLFMVPSGLSPSGLLNSPGFFSPQSPFGMSHQQALAQVTAQAAFAQSQKLMQAEYQFSSEATAADSLTHQPSFGTDEALQQQMLPSTSDPQSSIIETSQVCHSDRNDQPQSLVLDKPSNDGYNWRKYGQKPVKGSEYPRSYYKCTHLSCPVKKKVERSSDGQITEIIYKGQHNHDLPQPNKRARDGIDVKGSVISQAKPELGLQGVVRNLNKSSESAPALSEHSKNQASSREAPMQLATANNEEVGVADISEEQGDDDERNPKRRNSVGTSEAALSHKTIAEPKIIVQTRSEVDILDDGYKWRKYGQKVVRGNPYPRSYYKCTSAGCSVRKHVERASTDPKAVITTYEGKHNHDVPAGRKSNLNATNNSESQLKSNKVVTNNHPLLKERSFTTSDQRPAVLQLKEEQVLV